jgi:outer membrane protein OmpA-like peptidoglycan-associated protein
MKNSKYLFHFLLFCLLSFSVLGQKKKGFLERINSGLDKVNNGLNKVLGYKVYNGEWYKRGGGCWGPAGNFEDYAVRSPLNQGFVAKVNYKGTPYGLSLTTNGVRNFGYAVYDPYGKMVHLKISENQGTQLATEFTPQITGDYMVIVFTARRFQNPLDDSGGTFTFSMQCEGLTPIKTDKVFIENMEWGIRGSGGFGVTFNGLGITDHTFYSPRNTRYKIKAKKGSWIHAVIEPMGVKPYIALFDPYGQKLNSNSFEVLAEAKTDGEYLLIVGTEDQGENGRYNLFLAGNFLENPIKQDFNSVDVSGEFTSAFQKTFTFDIHSNSYLDAHFISKDKSCQLVFKDRSGEELLRAPNYYDRNTIKVSQPTTITATLDCKDNSSGFYDLVFFGDFSLKDSQPKVSSTSPISSENTVKAQGSIQSGQTNTDYSSIKVVADDYGTGQRATETSPDKTGKYTLDLEPGKKYSITVLSDGKYIASTENIDLTSGDISSIKPQPITLLGSADIGKKLTLNNIFFETGSPILLRQSYAELKRAAAFLKANPKMKIEIAGHTDSVGDDASNLTLSQNRANAVLYYLQDQLDDFSRLSAKGYGKNEPIATNNTEEGRRQNRRVELKIVGN